MGRKRKNPKYNKPLSPEDRQAIESGCNRRDSKVDIAEAIHKDPSTVGKEIKLHKTLKKRFHLPLECMMYIHCTRERHCVPSCPDFRQFKCTWRDRSPGVCNGCAESRSCDFDQFYYFAADAQQEYEDTLRESREGVSITEELAKQLEEVVVPLLIQGQSPYVIIQNHQELGICEKTLYNYIDRRVIKSPEFMNITLRRKTSRKLPKKTKKAYKDKGKQDKAYLKGRTYVDYERYMKDRPDASVVQMDTVYNDITLGPFVQTFKFIKLRIMIAFYHDKKEAADMTHGVELLDEVLGRDLFNLYVEVLLTDRGSEFYDVDGVENRKDGTRRTRMFFCDPLSPGQKGSLEQNHSMLRDIIPKAEKSDRYKDLHAIGLTGQEALNHAISNVASTKIKLLNGQSPIERARSVAPEVWKRFEAFGIREIPGDEVVLTPKALEKFRKEANRG